MVSGNFFQAVTAKTLSRLNTINLKTNQSLRNLATGMTINTAADGPALLISSQNLRATMAFLEGQITSLQRADQVAATADAALGEVSSLLSEANALEVELANSSGLSGEEQAAIQGQIDSILQAVDRIGSTTTFNGQNLLDGSATLRAGRDTLAIAMVAARTLGATMIDGQDYLLADIASSGALADDPTAGQQVIATAISNVATARARIGAFQSDTLATRIDLFSTAIESISAADAIARGGDFALEAAELARNSALQSASFFVLAKANENQRLVLNLLS